MKFVKVTALAAAMAASFGAQAELAAMDEEALEEVTGQAGITIEQSLAATTIHYVDGDGADVAGTNAIGGSLELVIDTPSFDNTTFAANATGAAIRMDIDVVDQTPGSGSQGALRISQQITAGAGETGYLHVSGVQITPATTDDLSGNAAFSNILANTANTSASIGDIYVELGATTMYVYGH